MVSSGVDPVHSARFDGIYPDCCIKPWYKTIIHDVFYWPYQKNNKERLYDFPRHFPIILLVSMGLQNLERGQPRCEVGLAN